MAFKKWYLFHQITIKIIPVPSQYHYLSKILTRKKTRNKLSIFLSLSLSFHTLPASKSLFLSSSSLELDDDP
jgi:hypothetical protein